MFCFYIHNLQTGQERHMYGYTAMDAYRRSKLNPEEWEIYAQDYED